MSYSNGCTSIYGNIKLIPLVTTRLSQEEIYDLEDSCKKNELVQMSVHVQIKEHNKEIEREYDITQNIQVISESELRANAPEFMPKSCKKPNRQINADAPEFVPKKRNNRIVAITPSGINITVQQNKRRKCKGF
jgi:hypothetical protein